MATSFSIARSGAREGQFTLWCRSCGASTTLARGFCRPCYAALRHDFAHFGGLRSDVLERDRRACRICCKPHSTEHPVHVHHRRRGVSRAHLLIALCPAHHALVHRLQVLDRMLPALLIELWREQHPGAPEQLFLDFGEETCPVSSPMYLWEQALAG